MTHGLTKEDIQEILESAGLTPETFLENITKIEEELESALIDFYIERGKGGSGYIALRRNPRTGEIWNTGWLPSWECSEEEYYGKYGFCSTTTLQSYSGCWGSAGPEDGFCWIADEEGDYIGCAESASWKNIEELDEEEIEELETDGWYRFSVDASDPVDGWDCAVDLKEMQKEIDDLVDYELIREMRESRGAIPPLLEPLDSGG